MDSNSTRVCLWCDQSLDQAKGRVKLAWPRHQLQKLSLWWRARERKGDFQHLTEAEISDEQQQLSQESAKFQLHRTKRQKLLPRLPFILELEDMQLLCQALKHAPSTFTLEQMLDWFWQDRVYYSRDDVYFAIVRLFNDGIITIYDRPVVSSTAYELALSTTELEALMQSASNVNAGPFDRYID